MLAYLGADVNEFICSERAQECIQMFTVMVGVIMDQRQTSFILL